MDLVNFYTSGIIKANKKQPSHSKDSEHFSKGEISVFKSTIKWVKSQRSDSKDDLLHQLKIIIHYFTLLSGLQAVTLLCY